MNSIRLSWLDENAVTCRVFKGRWNISHCLRMYFEISDLKIEMATRGGGKVTKYRSSYNPCRRCKVLAGRLREIPMEADSTPDFNEKTVGDAMVS